jgi:mono/diheme cytochrome c family protein
VVSRPSAGALFAVAAVLVATRVGGAQPKTAVPYTRAQAVVGAKEYEANCSACHGARLEGGAGPALTGAKFALRAKRTQMTVGDLFANVAQQMPLNEPASLTHAQYVAIGAYLLMKNGYAPGATPLTYGAAMKSGVPMGAREK